MKLEQAVFVSATIGHEDKICLAGRTSCVDDQLAKQVFRWVPERWELAQRHAEGIAFFRVNDNFFGVSRSVRGASDLRGRGEKQLVTSVLLIRREQMKAFSNNGAILAVVAQTHGGLLLPSRLGAELKPFDLPNETSLRPVVSEPEKRAKEVETITRAIEIHQQVAVVGLEDPLDYVAGYLSHLPTEKKLGTSWAVGLDVAKSRPFDLQFFWGFDSAVQKELAQLQVRTIALEPALI